MESTYGMTTEMYRAVVAVIDERMKAITVTREDFDRVVAGQKKLEDRMERVEAALVRMAEAQARTDEKLERLTERVDRLTERVDKLSERVDQLAEAQLRTEKRLDQLTEAQLRTEKRLDELAEAQLRTEKRLDQLTEAQFRTEKRLDQLAKAQCNTEASLRTQVNIVAALKGTDLERKYRERARSYWGKVLRRAQAYLPTDLEEELETQLSETDYEALFNLDLIVSGKPKALPDQDELWLAVEVSAHIDRHDVERAIDRANILKKAGYFILPAVIGENATKGAQDLAQTSGVVVNLNGHLSYWDEALSSAAP